MKVFACKDLGLDCSKTLSAESEEKLVEMASIHAREAHGMNELSQEAIGKIRQLFVHPSSADAARVVDRIFEKYHCSSDPDCTWRYISEAEMILTGKPSVHEKELKAA